jgi:hypothetical protein
MPISQTKARKQENKVRFVNGLPWPVRVNNKLGAFARDEDTPIIGGSIQTVPLAIRYLVGVLPPRNNYDSFLASIKDEQDCPRPEKLTPQQQICRFADRYLEPFVLLHHVPLPKQLATLTGQQALLWPKKVVTASFFKSIGLRRDGNGLLGSFGVLPTLEAQGLNPVDVILTVGFEKVEKSNRSYFINTFESHIPDPKEDKEDCAFQKECRDFIDQWVKENPNETEFPMPGDQLMIDVEPSDIISPSEDYIAKATNILKAQASVVFEPDELATIQLEGIAYDVLAGRSLMPAEAETEAIIQTVDVAPVE